MIGGPLISKALSPFAHANLVNQRKLNDGIHYSKGGAKFVPCAHVHMFAGGSGETCMVDVTGRLVALVTYMSLLRPYG